MADLCRGIWRLFEQHTLALPLITPDWLSDDLLDALTLVIWFLVLVEIVVIGMHLLLYWPEYNTARQDSSSARGGQAVTRIHRPPSAPSRLDRAILDPPLRPIPGILTSCERTLLLLNTRLCGKEREVGSVYLVVLAFSIVVLAPFFLLAWISRKGLSGLGCTWTRHRRTPAMESSTFRFLDLSPELCNHVYTHCSNDLVIAYKTSRDCRFDLERNGLVQVLCNLLRPFEVDWESTRTHHHQLGLPWVGRQMYVESSRLHFENTAINFDFCHRDSSLPRLTKFMAAFRDKLQFMRKLCIPLTVAETILIGSTLHEPIVSPAAKKELLRIRRYLPNVQQVHILPDPNISTCLDHTDYPFHHQALSFVVMYQLAHPQNRQALSNTFPRLMDITTTNEFGSERFRQVGGSWQRWYSREMISTQRRRPRLLRFAPVTGSELFDCITSLTTQHTLQWIWP